METVAWYQPSFRRGQILQLRMRLGSVPSVVTAGHAHFEHRLAVRPSPAVFPTIAIQELRVGDSEVKTEPIFCRCARTADLRAGATLCGDRRGRCATPLQLAETEGCWFARASLCGNWRGRRARAAAHLPYERRQASRTMRAKTTGRSFVRGS